MCSTPQRQFLEMSLCKTAYSDIYYNHSPYAGQHERANQQRVSANGSTVSLVHPLEIRETHGVTQTRKPITPYYTDGSHEETWLISTFT